MREASNECVWIGLLSPAGPIHSLWEACGAPGWGLGPQPFNSPLLASMGPSPSCLTFPTLADPEFQLQNSPVSGRPQVPSEESRCGGFSWLTEQ